MSNAGYVLLWRKVRDKQLFRTRPFCELGAWVDLIMEANFSQGSVGTVELARGELVVTERGLAERWGWNKQRVRRFLQELQADGSITKLDQKRTKIRINNYERYQPVRLLPGPTVGPKTDQEAPSLLISTNESMNSTLTSTKRSRRKPVINPAEEDPVTLEFPQVIDTPDCRAKWAEFVSYRRAIKKPLTNYLPSLKGMLTKAAAYGAEAFCAAVDATIASGKWEGLYPENHIPGAASPARKTRQQIRDEEWAETKRLAAASRRALNEKLGRA